MTKQANQDVKRGIMSSIRQTQREAPSKTVLEVCQAHGISKSTYYNWCRQEGSKGLAPKSRRPHSFGNQIDPRIRKMILDTHLMEQESTPHDIFRYLEAKGVQVSANTVAKTIRAFVSKRRL